MTLKRTTGDELDFRNLVIQLDQYLKIANGDKHFFYAQFNKIVKIKNVVICYSDNSAVGCGSFKEFDRKTVEIKRMFVHPEFRRKGIANNILKELELWAAEINYSECILETTENQHQAITLYIKLGYSIVPNYGQYKNVESSIC